MTTQISSSNLYRHKHLTTPHHTAQQPSTPHQHQPSIQARHHTSYAHHPVCARNQATTTPHPRTHDADNYEAKFKYIL